LFAVYYQMAGVPMDHPDRLLIGNISDGMPASKTDLHVGDVIDSINGVKIGTDYEKMIGLISKSANVPITFNVLRDGKQISFKITPRPDPETGEGKVGISAAYPTRPAGFGETITLAGKAMKAMTISIFDGFKKLILGQFKLDDLGGPVRTAQVTSQIAEQGITELTSWAALLSLYLGIFNLLPIPALDGSRLIFLGLEAVRGRPIDPNRESMVHFIGFAMLMLLMLAVTYNDILRLVRGEH
jgi:regulator of sigma E protease